MVNYPIEGLMNTAMNSIKEMVDVNTIVGEAIVSNNDVVIIPVSKVNFGFVAGGSEFKVKQKEKEKEDQNDINRMPFGGGSGAGVSINPVAFIVVQNTGVKLLPVEHSSALDKLIDLVPDLVDKVNYMIDKQVSKFEKRDNAKKVKVETNENQPEKKVPYDVEYDETGDL